MKIDDKSNDIIDIIMNSEPEKFKGIPNSICMNGYEMSIYNEYYNEALEIIEQEKYKTKQKLKKIKPECHKRDDF